MKTKSSFVIIHGIGEQNPFKTLDSFARGIVGVLSAANIKYSVCHQIRDREDIGDGRWTESFVSIEMPDRTLDIHEYYWAYLTENKINTSEVMAWLHKTIHTAVEGGAEDKALLKEYEKHGGMCFREWGVKLRLLSFFFLDLLPSFNFMPAVAGKLLDWLKEKAGGIIIQYVGDVAIYTTMDEKSENFRLRRKIIANSLDLIEHLFNDDCDEIIIAGHSLGSVIAYDTLNRLNQKANLPNGDGWKTEWRSKLGRIKGFITFGSPLDKVEYLFQTRPDKKEFIRSQIVKHLP